MNFTSGRSTLISRVEWLVEAFLVPNVAESFKESTEGPFVGASELPAHSAVSDTGNFEKL